MLRRGSLSLLTSALLVWSQPCHAVAAIAAPTVAPAAVARGVSTTVRVAAFLPSAARALASNSPVLLQVDASGKTVAVLGALRDDGTGGDLVAGDSIYSRTVKVKDSVAGLIRLRVSASLSGQLTPALSDISTLQVLPAGLPRDVRVSDRKKIVVDPQTSTRLLGNQVIVFMSPEADPLAVTRAASLVQGKVVGLLAGFKLNAWQIELPSTSSSEVRKAIATLGKAAGVQGAEPNWVLEAGGVVPNDPGFAQQWGLPRIRADVAWAVDRFNCPGCTPIAIGIVDTGVNYNAPDFTGTGKVILGRNLVLGAPNPPMDDNGHGTQVAGIAAANMNDSTGVVGVAPRSHLVVVKALDSNLSGLTSDVAAGVQDAVDLGARVVNLSLGGSDSSLARLQILASALDYANRHNSVVVSIAGNYGCGIKRWYPAGFDDTYQSGATTYDTRVIAVGATDQTENRAVWNPQGVACDDSTTRRGYLMGSNYGDWVDLYAPGTAIRSIDPNYAVPNGTSFAAPFVSGAAALLLDINPALDATQVRELLVSTAEERGTQEPCRQTQCAPTATCYSQPPCGPNDSPGRYIKRLNIFKAVFQTAARTCTTCPEAPDAYFGTHNIWPSPWLDLGMQSVNGVQSMSVHGVSVPLRPAASYDVQVEVRLWSTDRYSTMRYADAFSVSTSASPYWDLALTDPLTNPANPLSLGFWWGYDGPGPLPPNMQATYSGEVTAHLQGGANNLLNIVLDTAKGRDADHSMVSSGIIDVVDITPH